MVMRSRWVVWVGWVEWVGARDRVLHGSAERKAVSTQTTVQSITHPTHNYIFYPILPINNIINERVGKCKRLDKCCYHYTPKQCFTDNPRERDKYLVEDGSLRPCGYHYTPREYFTDNSWLRGDNFFSFSKHRILKKKKIENPQPAKLTGRLPRWFSGDLIFAM